MRRVIRLILVYVIPAVILLITLGAYKYADNQGLFQQREVAGLAYDEYTLSRTKYWGKRFDYLTEKGYNEVRRRIADAHDHYLQIRRGHEKYSIEYEYEVDGEIIESVTEVSEQDDQTSYGGRYFLVKYHKFIEVVYFDLSKSTKQSVDWSSVQYQSQVCLQLPIESEDNVRYHIDEHNNIWIVTLSMNKIVFVQIYSCAEGRLIRQYRYALEGNQFVSEIYRVVKKQRGCMHVQTITYGLARVDIEVCPYAQRDYIKEVARYNTSQLIHNKKQARQWKVYSVVDESAWRNQFFKIMNYILEMLQVGYRFPVAVEPWRNPVEDVFQQFNTVVADEKNGYLINLSGNKSESGLVALDRFMINARTPLFHGNSDYRQFGALELLKKMSEGGKFPEFVHRYIDSKTNQTKKLYYKAAFKTQPNFKIEHIGLGDKALVFWPDHRLEDKDYLAIRTVDGGVISHKGEFKGVYDKLPVNFEQLLQRVDQKPLQVAAGIYQFHAKEQSLISRPVYFENIRAIGKVQLVNALNGKYLVSHSIKMDQGCRYTSSFLLNNEWWVLQYCEGIKQSIVKKYQFFVMVSNPEKILSLQMVYGLVGGVDHQNGDDDLADLMDEFMREHKNGYMLLSVYRCIDQYYYVEYTDASGSVYGVARIHFKRLSNRWIRKAQGSETKESNSFKRQVMVQESQMIAAKYDEKAYAVAVKGIDVFSHMADFVLKDVANQSWFSFCLPSGVNFRRLHRLQRYYYFPQQSYSLGDYGCNYGSDSQVSERIFSFNMRNMIIQGRLSDQRVRLLRRQIVYFIFCWFPVYGVVGLIVLMVIGRKGEQQKKQEEKKQQQKKVEQKQKKNK